MEKYQLELLNSITAFVEASSFEHLSLWRDNKYLENPREWREESMGFGFDVGSMEYEGKSYPVFISLRFAEIDNIKLCFYSATSQMVNWIKIELYLRSLNPNAKLVDAYNFHNAFKTP